jgi:AraC family transcriptional regulator
MLDFSFRLKPRAGELTRCSTVLNGVVGRRDYHVERFRTTLSLKSVVRGEAWYRNPGCRYRLDSSVFLILNEDQEYWLDIAAGSGTETLCPFWQPGLVEHVAATMTTPEDRHLDELAPQGEPIDFCERLYAKSGLIAAGLGRLHAGLRSPGVSQPWLEDEMYGLAAELVRLRQELKAEVADFPGRRPATRAELYRRLHRGRDYLESCYHEPLSVAAVARIACLSPYHFQRMFQAAFGQSPMRYLQARRLRAACQLLAQTDADITSIGLRVGFESLGSFSWLFRRKFGMSPRQFRRQFGKEHD